MRLRNTTTIPNETARDVLRFVCPSGVSGYDVELRNARCGSVLKGRAYTQGSGYHDRAGAFVTLYVAENGTRGERGRVRYPIPPVPVRSHAGYLPRPYLADRIEALVYLAAHELRHLWQSKIKRGRRVWGARGQFSERDADAYAIHMLRQWRKSR